MSRYPIGPDLALLDLDDARRRTGPASQRPRRRRRLRDDLTMHAVLAAGWAVLTVASAADSIARRSPTRNMRR